MFKNALYPTAILPLLLTLGHVSTPVTNSSKADIGSFKTISINDSATTVEKSNTYTLWNLQNVGLSKQAFEYAMKGYKYLDSKKLLHNNHIITIIDYSKPSTQKRLYILDVITGKVLYNSLVAHGHNSGYEFATQFSNSNKSHETSLGFYITASTYIGGNGYSLRLQGCEKGFNDNAYKREIVLHGADYVSEEFIHSRGFIGRSYGCPAVPFGLHKEIIDCIKDGSCFFAYYPAKKYLTHSKILNSHQG